MDTRICTACGLEKESTEFNKHPRGKSGLQPTCRDCNKKRCREYRNKLIVEVLRAYGGKCVCCGEDNPLFLTLDHVNSDGAQHRREIGSNGPRGANADRVYRWAKQNNYPNVLQVMCFNCNCGKQRNGGMLCPHISWSPIGSFGGWWNWVEPPPEISRAYDLLKGDAK